MKQIRDQAVRFHYLVNSIKNRGFKKKELANYLELPAPVFSSLSKTVVPKIIEIEPGLPTEKLKDELNHVFSMVNNLSQSKIVSKMELFVNKLEELYLRDANSSKSASYFTGLRNQAEYSFDRIKKYYEGVYIMYYLSSDKYCIKKDSFMIRCNSVEKIAEVYKGNKHSSVCYNGLAIINNSHTLTIQMTEMDDKPEEFLMMHLSLPFARELKFLRGIFSCLNFARQPIARKTVLIKTDIKPDHITYDEIVSEYYPKKGDLNIPEIEQYLLSDKSYIECRTVPNPGFGLNDLLKELNI
jgi:hypothetical protein